MFTFENYRWAHAILDSRAIWWSGQRHLVPLLDLINCAEGPTNPSRVHATKLDSTVRTNAPVVLLAWLCHFCGSVYKSVCVCVCVCMG